MGPSTTTERGRLEERLVGEPEAAPVHRHQVTGTELEKSPPGLLRVARSAVETNQPSVTALAAAVDLAGSMILEMLTDLAARHTEPGAFLRAYANLANEMAGLQDRESAHPERDELLGDPE